MVTLDPYWLTLIISVFLPMIVALVTKQVASGAVKSLVLLALSALTGTLTSIGASGDSTFDLKSAAVTTVVSFITAVGFHYGLLNNINVTGTDGAIQTKTADFGIGGSQAGG